MTPFQERLRGNVPALLTPLDKQSVVDRDAMRQTTRRLIDNGCRGVVVVGTTGEFTGIDVDQREIAIRTVVDEVSGEVPVIVGAGCPTSVRPMRRRKPRGTSALTVCWSTRPSIFR